MTGKFLSKLRLKNQLARECLAEFLGTFILLTFGTASVAQKVLSDGDNGSALSIHWSWGIGVTLGIYVAGGVSGAHLNPAVTIALACLGKCPWKKTPVYMLAQYLGAFIASACVYLVYIDALKHHDNGVRVIDGVTGTAGIWSTYPTSYVSTWNCFGDQIFSTAILLLCILAITDTNNMQPTKGVLAISVGLLVVAIGMTFGHNCGYAINPARDLGPRLFTSVAGWGKAPFSYRDYNYFWVPVVGPHLGGILGALVYQLCVGMHWPEDEKIISVQNMGEKSKLEYDGPYSESNTQL
ncbi:hypothetical protein ACF0H5_012653 [Mactra antiquata]